MKLLSALVGYLLLLLSKTRRIFQCQAEGGKTNYPVRVKIKTQNPVRVSPGRISSEYESPASLEETIKPAGNENKEQHQKQRLSNDEGEGIEIEQRDDDLLLKGSTICETKAIEKRNGELLLTTPPPSEKKMGFRASHMRRKRLLVKGASGAGKDLRESSDNKVIGVVQNDTAMKSKERSDVTLKTRGSGNVGEETTVEFVKHQRDSKKEQLIGPIQSLTAQEPKPEEENRDDDPTNTREKDCNKDDMPSKAFAEEKSLFDIGQLMNCCHVSFCIDRERLAFPGRLLNPDGTRITNTMLEDMES
jgi:hypothetical protein